MVRSNFDLLLFFLSFQDLCVTMQKSVSKNLLTLAAWFPDDRKWPREDLNEGKKLFVKIIGKCPKSWKYKSREIKCEVIKGIIQESWGSCFIFSRKEVSDIRVGFQGIGYQRVISHNGRPIDPIIIYC